MRHIFISFFLFCFCFAFRAQVLKGSNEEIRNTNSNKINKVSTNSNFAPASNAETIQADSISYKKDSKIEAKGKAYKTKSRNAKSNKVIQLNASYNQTKKISSSQSFQRSPTQEQQLKLDQLSTEMLQEDPEGVESNLNFYSAGNYDVQRESNLRTAQQKEPDNKEVLKYVSANAIIKNENETAKESLQKLKSLNELNDESIYYAKDVVQSACGNSTLITHGFVDTYGMNYVQLLEQNSCSNDLTIISLDFLQSDFYRKKLSEKGYVIPKSKNVNVSYLKEFCQKNKNKNIAISMTVPKPYLIELAPNLFPVGLVFEYADVPRTSFSKLIELWENKLNKKVIYNFQSPLGNKLCANYLPMLFYLKQYYQVQKNESKSRQVDTDINRITEKAKLKKKK